MKLGYSRAARLIEIMEANGIVGPSQGSKREILINPEDYPAGVDVVVGARGWFCPLKLYQG